MAREFEFGDRVTFANRLDRRVQTRTWFDGSGGRRSERWKMWHSFPWAQRTGIVIGHRHLANGTTLWDDEAGHEFEPREYLTAYLVAYAMHRRPVLVLAEHLTPAVDEPAPEPTPDLDDPMFETGPDGGAI